MKILKPRIYEGAIVSPTVDRPDEMIFYIRAHYRPEAPNQVQSVADAIFLLNREDIGRLAIQIQSVLKGDQGKPF